jgi:nitric oxide synthase oxygenase domain/subunit
MDNLRFNGYSDNDGTEKVANINKQSHRVEWNLVEVDVKYEICNLLLKLNKEEPETWKLDPNDVRDIAIEMKLNCRAEDFEGLVQLVPRR